MSPRAALKMIRDHGHDGWVDGATTIGAVSISVAPDGSVYREAEIIATDPHTVREWLGY